MKDKSKRQKWLHLRVTDNEYGKLQTAYKGTICRKFSEYLRDVLFRQSITVYYRNKSADEFLTVALLLKNELTSIGKNFNQVVKKVNTSSNDLDLSGYLYAVLIAQSEVVQKTRELCQRMEQIYIQLNAERDEVSGKKLKPDDPALGYAAAADQQENKSGH
jgi:MobC-like protein